jgi:alpha/beta superfamily hydrolase
MAVSFADTSFLFSLYGNDAHTASAKAWMRQRTQPITITTLNRYEFGNAMRFAVFRRFILQTDAESAQIAFEADIQSGYLQLTPCDYSAVIEDANRLSTRYTSVGGHRSFDVLRVATARIVKSSAFLSFDANQRKLASAVGLAVAP